MLPGLPPEMLKMMKELDFVPSPYDPLNKLRKNRDRKKLNKHRMVKKSRRINRS